VNGLKLWVVIAGAVLIAVAISVALFDGSDSESAEPSNDPYALKGHKVVGHYLNSSWITDNPLVEVVDKKQIFDDEAVVFAAIYRDQSLDGDCLTAFTSNNSPGSNFYYGYSSDYIHRLTWSAPHDDDTIKKVIIQCDISGDVTSPDWDDCGKHHAVIIEYPLKSGIYADIVNSQIRESVSNLISTYLTRAIERSGCGMSGEGDRGHPRIGYFELDAFVTFANEGLFSVHLQTGVQDPGSNTSNDYVDTLNFDLSTGKTFSLADMFHPNEDSYRALQRVAVAEANYLKFKGLRDMWGGGGPSDIHNYEKDDYRPELLEEQEFVLTENSIVLACEEYCFDGIVPELLHKVIPLEIPFSRLENFWDLAGPFRHFCEVDNIYCLS
jgi:hypothetical protein